MKNIEDVLNAIVRASQECQTWDFADQAYYISCLSKLGEICDKILAKYDGRGDRMQEFVDLLSGKENP